MNIHHETHLIEPNARREWSIGEMPHLDKSEDLSGGCIRLLQDIAGDSPGFSLLADHRLQALPPALICLNRCRGRFADADAEEQVQQNRRNGGNAEDGIDAEPEP